MIAVYVAADRPVSARFRRSRWWKFWERPRLVPGSVKFGIVRDQLVGYCPDMEAALRLVSERDLEAVFEELPDPPAADARHGPRLPLVAERDVLDRDPVEEAPRWPKVPVHA